MEGGGSTFVSGVLSFIFSLRSWPSPHLRRSAHESAVAAARMYMFVQPHQKKSVVWT